MDKCAKCGADVRTEVLPCYEAKNELQGMGVALFDCVKQSKCSGCGATQEFIPDMVGLLSAVAVCRATVPWKLHGYEIRFLRKAIELSAKDFARVLEVSQETLSRWENDKAPIGPANEKLLRIVVGLTLAEKAPGIFFDPEQVTSMKIRSVRDSDAPPLLALCRGRIKRPMQKQAEEAWSEERKVA
jgi:transcriptional regulator with XRE-family HTH domain